MTVKRKQYILALILIVFYAVGLIGLTGEHSTDFAKLTPLNLFISLICLVLSFGRIGKKQVIDLLLIGVLGFGIEVMGVHTHWLFGNYTYGKSLGWPCFDVPLMMSVNWVLLCFSSTALVVKLGKSSLFQAVIASLLMTALDMLIEPIAVKFDFWSWEGSEIPVYNYVCWFVLSLPLNWWILNRKTTVQNSVSITLFALLAVFFGTLNCV